MTRLFIAVALVALLAGTLCASPGQPAETSPADVYYTAVPADLSDAVELQVAQVSERSHATPEQRKEILGLARNIPRNGDVPTIIRLREIGETVIPVVVPLMSSSDSSIRYKALRALNSLTSPVDRRAPGYAAREAAVLNIVRRATYDKDAEVRKLAVYTLKGIGSWRHRTDIPAGVITELNRVAVDDPDPKARETALRQLRKLHLIPEELYYTAVPADLSDAIERQVAQVSERSPATPDQPREIMGLACNMPRDGDAQKAEQLREIGEAIIPVVIPLMRFPDSSLRYGALQAITSLTSPVDRRAPGYAAREAVVLNIVRRATYDKDAAVRKLAVDSIRDIASGRERTDIPAGVITELNRVAVDDPDPKVRETALCHLRMLHLIPEDTKAN